MAKLPTANRQPTPSSQSITIPAKDRPLVAVKLSNGHWYAGHFTFTPLNGKVLTRDYQGRIVSVVYAADTVVSVIRIDSSGVYRGQADSYLQANGQGTYLANNGDYYEGHWQNDKTASSWANDSDTLLSASMALTSHATSTRKGASAMA